MSTRCPASGTKPPDDPTREWTWRGPTRVLTWFDCPECDQITALEQGRIRVHFLPAAAPYGPHCKCAPCCCGCGREYAK